MKISRASGASAVAATCALISIIPSVARAQDGGKETAPAKMVSPTPDAPPRQGFSIVLLLGEMQGVDGEDAVPPAARRALNDLKEFLPYKSYRLLDSQWTLCCSGAASGITRLRGLEEQEYELELRASDVSFRGPLHVRFVLREPGDRESAFKADVSERFKQQELAERVMKEQELVKLERELIDLSAEHNALKRQSEVGVKDPADLKRLSAQIAKVNERIHQLRSAAQASVPVKSYGRPVIDTSFQMAIGETVVVGTSRLKGGSRALIAVLTAVAKPKPRSNDSR
jgi:hypothetical protein